MHEASYERNYTASFTMQFHCGDCNQDTSFTRNVVPGNNTVDVTCSGCGEHWHISFLLLSFEPLVVEDYELRRMLGIIKDGVFYGKGSLQ